MIEHVETSSVIEAFSSQLVSPPLLINTLSPHISSDSGLMLHVFINVSQVFLYYRALMKTGRITLVVVHVLVYLQHHKLHPLHNCWPFGKTSEQIHPNVTQLSKERNIAFITYHFTTIILKWEICQYSPHNLAFGSIKYDLKVEGRRFVSNDLLH